MKNKSILAAFATAAALAFTGPALAQDTPNSSFSVEEMIEYAEGFHFGYIRSGSNRLDSYSENGLSALAKRLAFETNVPVQATVYVGLDLERDNLNLFPVIFWSVTNQSDRISETAREKLQSYIDHGGILFIDTSDISTRNECAGLMREVIGDLNTRPFVHMPSDHTLTKTFFLLHNFTDEETNNPFCIESNDEDSVESLSNIIISDIGVLRELIPQQTTLGSVQREMLIRQLINVALYATTGDYKTDLTHLPALLERMGDKNKTPEPN